MQIARCWPASSYAGGRQRIHEAMQPIVTTGARKRNHSYQTMRVMRLQRGDVVFTEFGAVSQNATPPYDGVTAVVGEAFRRNSVKFHGRSVLKFWAAVMSPRAPGQCFASAARAKASSR